jgi:uncharacterized protein YegJ (DUF2314 family)
MSRKIRIAYLLVVILVASLAACSKQDRTISVDDKDPEMAAAIAKARDMLPQFWQVLEKPEHGESGFALKVKITDPRGTEHFWATDVERRDGKIMGTINNDPNIVRNVKFGQRIEIPEADISDWLYLRDRKMVGNYTVRPLFKHMPAAEVEQVKRMMAEP